MYFDCIVLNSPFHRIRWCIPTIDATWDNILCTNVPIYVRQSTSTAGYLESTQYQRSQVGGTNRWLECTEQQCRGDVRQCWSLAGSISRPTSPDKTTIVKTTIKLISSVWQFAEPDVLKCMCTFFEEFCSGSRSCFQFGTEFATLSSQLKKWASFSAFSMTGQFPARAFPNFYNFSSEMYFELNLILLWVERYWQN